MSEDPWLESAESAEALALTLGTAMGLPEGVLTSYINRGKTTSNGSSSSRCLSLRLRTRAGASVSYTMENGQIGIDALLSGGSVDVVALGQYSVYVQIVNQVFAQMPREK